MGVIRDAVAQDAADPLGSLDLDWSRAWLTCCDMPGPLHADDCRVLSQNGTGQ